MYPSAKKQSKHSHSNSQQYSSPLNKTNLKSTAPQTLRDGESGILEGLDSSLANGKQAVLDWKILNKLEFLSQQQITVNREKMDKKWIQIDKQVPRNLSVP